MELGTDIVEIERVAQAIAHHSTRFLNRLFTSKEQEYCLRQKESARHFAGRFAAKEAVAKALGTGFGKNLSWLDIEISNDKRGKPVATLALHLQKKYPNATLSISISHCKTLATAVALFTRTD